VKRAATIPPEEMESETQDFEMSAADEGSDRRTQAGGLGINDGPSQRGSGSPTPDHAPMHAAPAPARRRMVITHDKFMTLQSLIVIHLSSVERNTGKGIDRDELIDWYLELKESEIQDVEELEYEKELITKMLRKLVKVCSADHSLLGTLVALRHSPLIALQDNYLIEVKGDFQESLPSLDDDSQDSSTQARGDVRVFYMVHPSVDTEGSSSMP
jgi:DNA replication licensing factor MCM6